MVCLSDCLHLCEEQDDLRAQLNDKEPQMTIVALFAWRS
uniref:Uncharacterized protein n=1 Tax=Arundo donax TaxID=35708 RepID=A0A0A9H1D3_ARUDO